MKCSDPPSDAIIVPGAAAFYVLALRRTGPHKLKDMIVPKGARRDLARMLKLHIRQRLENDVKSTNFIRAISAFESDGC